MAADGGLNRHDPDVLGNLAQGLPLVAFLPRLAGPEPSDFRAAKPSGIGSRQRSAALETRDRFEKLVDLIGAEHNRQFARFAPVRNPLGDWRLAERDAVEKSQSSDDLVQPGHEMPVDNR